MKTIEILTEEGFKPFDGIISRGLRSTLIFELSNGESLRCTPDHQLRVENECGEPVIIESMFLDSNFFKCFSNCFAVFAENIPIDI